MAQSIAIVRYSTRPESADENQRLVEKVLAELDATKPEGVGYSVFRLADGVTFVHVAVFEREGNPLAELQAFQEFASGIGQRCDEPPTPAQASLIGAYSG
jgi:hypothetical protein